MSEKMIFCVGEGKYESKGVGYQKHLQIFNTQVSEEEYNKVKSALDVKNFKLPTATWVKSEDMTAEEKKNHSSHKELGGYLKVLSYKNAWKEMWTGLSKADRQFFLDLPHFNAEIFEKITGINVEKNDDATEEAIALLKEKGYKIVKE